MPGILLSPTFAGRGSVSLPPGPHQQTPSAGDRQVSKMVGSGDYARRDKIISAADLLLATEPTFQTNRLDGLLLGQCRHPALGRVRRVYTHHRTVAQLLVMNVSCSQLVRPGSTRCGHTPPRRLTGRFTMWRRRSHESGDEQFVGRCRHRAYRGRGRLAMTAAIDFGFLRRPIALNRSCPEQSNHWGGGGGDRLHELFHRATYCTVARDIPLAPLDIKMLWRRGSLS